MYSDIRYKVGIDIGYSTFKYVILDNDNNLIKKDYFFHKGKVEIYYKKLIKELKVLGDERFVVGIVGNLASRLVLHKRYGVNNIVALVEGAKYKNKDVKSIIEVGAQDTQFVNQISEESPSELRFYTNSSCASGTGAFLEEQATRLGINIEDLSEHVSKATSIPRIAGRCSVFSKTDMIHHMQDGVEINDILLGLCYALVRNYKANVIQKYEIQKPVLFAGGVMHNEGVLRALKDVLKLDDEDIILDEDHDFIGCYGACKVAERQKYYVSKSELEAIQVVKSTTGKKSIFEPLKAFGEGDALDKHLCKSKAREGYLGIDIGSTSVNLVVVDKDNEVIDYIYTKTDGRPKEVVLQGMETLRQRLGEDFKFKGIGTTGSGRVMIGKLIGADFVVNEITAQAKGATVVEQGVDTIFEIGGQDSKYIYMHKGIVNNFEMNKICAAGTGAFIEEQVKKLGIQVTEFGEYALKGENPVNLGDRCTVFIEGNIGKAIAEGENTNDICAGLAYSIVKNYLNRVVGNRKIGNKILLQGGIAHNQGVLNAFRALLGKEVIVPPFFSVTGALGMAVLTKEHLQECVSNEQAALNSDLKEQGEKFYLENYTGEINKAKKTVGIPRVLFINKMFPMFNEIFTKLGYNVVLSQASNEEIVALSQEYAFEETCFPVKLITGHCAWLLKQKVDYIFLPQLYTMKHEGSTAREDYACVYMQTSPKVMESVFDFEKEGVELISPVLSFNFGKKYMIETLLGIGEQLGKNKVETTMAVMAGMKKFMSYEKKMEELGNKIIKNVNPDQKVFVLISRVYNITDPTLNMGIEDKLIEMGYNVLHLGHLEASCIKMKDEYSKMCWPFGQHILTGLEEIKKHDNMFPIYITNHGCGPDTVLMHYFKEEMQDKPYLHIEIDEHSSKIGILTRLEAFVHSINQYEKIEEATSPLQINMETEKKYLLPNMPLYSDVMKGFLEKQGHEVELLKAVDSQSIELGKDLAMSKEYFSMIGSLSEVLERIMQDDKGYKLYFPMTEGNETFGQYGNFIRLKAKEKGKKLEIETPFLEDFLGDKHFGIAFIKAIIACDLIGLLPNEKRDYALQDLLVAVKHNAVDEAYLRNLCDSIKEEVEAHKVKKKLMVIGESLVVYKSFLNHGLIEKLEKEHYVMKQPLAEVLYVLWNDYGHKRNKKNNQYIKLLKQVKVYFEIVNEILAEYSPYQRDMEEMMTNVNKVLPHYAGGAGRYRLAKLLTHKDVDGMLIVNSMYENTATILKVLREKHRKDIKVPVLDLNFDSNKIGNNNEVLETFLSYI